jgi:hypothetical protein
VTEQNQVCKNHGRRGMSDVTIGGNYSTSVYNEKYYKNLLRNHWIRKAD